MRANAIRYNTLCLPCRSVYCVWLAVCPRVYVWAFIWLFSSLYYYFIPLFHFLVSRIANAPCMCRKRLQQLSYTSYASSSSTFRCSVGCRMICCCCCCWCVWFLFWYLLLFVLLIRFIFYSPINTSRTCAIKNRFYFLYRIVFILSRSFTHTHEHKSSVSVWRTNTQYYNLVCCIRLIRIVRLTRVGFAHNHRFFCRCDDG